MSIETVEDSFQDNSENSISERNNLLAQQLYGAWNIENIRKIERQPTNPADPSKGNWIAELGS